MKKINLKAFLLKLKSSKFLFLTALSGIFILSPYLGYQEALSQGDHGRDLYCFWATAKGAVPYRDYWWVYGPIMPYYYALFIKLFGVGIKSVLLGNFFLKLLSGVLFFAILAPFVPRTFAFIAALWFWIFGFEFFFTYNHAGGILLLLTLACALMTYIRTSRPRYLLWGALSVFLLCLVKINFGISALLAFLASSLFYDKISRSEFSKSRRWSYFTIVLLVPAAVFLIYFIILKDLPVYAIRQCLPYLRSDHPQHAAPLNMAAMWWNAIAVTVNKNWPNRIFAFILITSIFQSLLMSARGGKINFIKNKFILSAGVLALFYIAGLHEFLFSGVLYRTFWSQPFSILLIFLFIGTAAHKYSKTVRWLVAAALVLIIALNYIPNRKMITVRKNERHYLGLDRARVHIGNDPQWIDTVTRTTNFLRSRLKDDETFFALPYEPIYYFLAGKISPVRMLIFFEHINIPAEQERELIAELEEKNVRWVLLSGRAFSPEAGMGILGKTFCPLTGAYLERHFKVEAAFGPWNAPDGWMSPHSVRILKRIEDDGKNG